jgi:hypothetical protein
MVNMKEASQGRVVRGGNQARWKLPPKGKYKVNWKLPHCEGLQLD